MREEAAALRQMVVEMHDPLARAYLLEMAQKIEDIAAKSEALSKRLRTTLPD
jgi:hypothetical protein